MTQSTEQERAEVICTDQGINVVKDDVLIAFIPWEQAARRAQVVPKRWSLHEAAQDALARLEDEDLNLTHNIRERLRFALAAAPQPPDANSAEFDRIKAAPVQIPEPWGVAVGDRIWVGKAPAHVPKIAEHEGLPLQKLYTEHQVRQLLAQHGVK